MSCETGADKIMRLLTIPGELYQNRKLIWTLAKNDFRTKYAGSYLGIIWAFVQPVVTVMVYWFVFGVVRQGAPKAVPFVLWLVSGLVPWFFFSEALIQSTNALIEYSYLVKKLVFKISILPLVKVTAALFVHGFFVLFIVFLYACYGYYPDIYLIQIPYYSLCVFIFVLAAAYTTSAVVIFFRDLTHLITIGLQVGLWMTPIMWDFQDMGIDPFSKTARLLKLNPMYYVVAGYRNALIDKQWFWETPFPTDYLRLVTIALFLFGAGLFRKLKVHFADVL